MSAAKPLIWIALIGFIIVMFRPTALLLAVGLIPTLLTLLFDRTPEKFGAYIKSEMTKWAKVVKDSGAKAN